MSELKLGFSRPWSIRFPTVTRFLDERYVEEFFSFGRLRLSTFSTCRNHKDEERCDPNEGRLNAEITTQNANHHILAINGQESYILCGGLVENPNMEAIFSTRHRVKILNPLAFADAVAGRIPGFVGGYQGNYIYRRETFIRKQRSALFGPPVSQDDMEKWTNDYDKFVALQASEAFFIKDLKYAHQNEYRFIWFAQGCEGADLYIDCPEAMQVCQKSSIV